MNFRNYKLILTFFLFSINLFSQQNENKLFKTSKISFVVKSDSINLDEFNEIIMIPGGRMFRKYFEKIGYFKNAYDYDTFKKVLKNENLKEDNGEPLVFNDYLKVYKKYKPYLVLNLKMGKNNVVELILSKPDIGEIFIVRNVSHTNVIGISAGTTQVYEDTWDSMMNEIVNYIRMNSKTYK
ncbi:hypothetical protein B0A58_10115 [Flavobacterium branchiophilum NBRC 15030 = ATCC 35035]|uniref:Uncharacterized protein n=1 Tax=Flavobacterium branchiophilum TaxID=55197 RepID=A0A543G794_9FLAO|nr:hypothetical protein [Flavobacterium branchiophilum]OXA74734.1 hypothetical protein B0A58_10115 [Flavobacterium branchiophilum NBRC 15030 = ATCC 35035]TQM41960.1 hypothetical protein BC670_2978 [Flavobacterium branchiophilum]GEM55057.1 hypothetical protein FB1_12780 [Flavobacterium branchiophilum NBRC 15030 = ATCC 35035]